FRRYLFEAQRAPDHITDYAYLLELAEGLRSGQHIILSAVAFLAERSGRDSPDITLVDGRGWRLAVSPAHSLPLASLRRPPMQCIWRKQSGPQEGPRQPGGLNQPLDFRMNCCKRVGLAEEWMRSLVGRGQKDYLWDVFCYPRKGSSKSCCR